MCEAVGEGAWPVDLVWRVGLRLGDWSWAVRLVQSVGGWISSWD